MNEKYKNMIINNSIKNINKCGVSGRNCIKMIRDCIDLAIDDANEEMIRIGKSFNQNNPLDYIDDLIYKNNEFINQLNNSDNINNSDQKYPAKKIK